MVLEEASGEYEVREGDCLWKIAEQFLGNGEEYTLLMDMNPDVITDPDLIYPHTYLQVKRNVYVRKRTDNAGTQLGPCHFGALMGWTAGIVESGEAYTSFAFTGSDGERVVCRIIDKEQVSVNTLSDWEGCRKAIEEYAEDNYGDQVTDLTFQHYRSERGDEIYLYSYVYTILGEKYGLKGTLPVYISHGICQTEHIQGEFLGFYTEEGMEDVVRYLAAGFEELPAAEAGNYSMNSYNVTLGPLKEWDLRGICNSFGWMEEYFDGIFTQEVTLEPEERSAKDRILNAR